MHEDGIIITYQTGNSAGVHAHTHKSRLFLVDSPDLDRRCLLSMSHSLIMVHGFEALITVVYR